MQFELSDLHGNVSLWNALWKSVIDPILDSDTFFMPARFVF